VEPLGTAQPEGIGLGQAGSHIRMRRRQGGQWRPQQPVARSPKGDWAQDARDDCGAHVAGVRGGGATAAAIDLGVLPPPHSSASLPRASSTGSKRLAGATAGYCVVRSSL
jgi:hypothetical protein